MIFGFGVGVFVEYVDEDLVGDFFVGLYIIVVVCDDFD